MKDEIADQVDVETAEVDGSNLQDSVLRVNELNVESSEEKISTRKQSNKKRPSSPLGQAVSGNSVDTVRLSAIIFKNMFAKKSMSVHHVQRRLGELGYHDAWSDIDGWYGDLTKTAIAEYQSDYGIAGDGDVNMETLESLFIDDENVEVTE